MIPNFFYLVFFNRVELKIFFSILTSAHVEFLFTTPIPVGSRVLFERLLRSRRRCYYEIINIEIDRFRGTRSDFVHEIAHFQNTTLTIYGNFPSTGNVFEK